MANSLGVAVASDFKMDTLSWPVSSISSSASGVGEQPSKACVISKSTVSLQEEGGVYGVVLRSGALLYDSPMPLSIVGVALLLCAEFASLGLDVVLEL